MKTERQTQERWGSRLGFILATSGAAVGLGNIQRFPTMAAQNGGGAFVLVYFLCVALLGIPLILVEFALGRRTRRNPYEAIRLLFPGSMWRLAGLLGILTAFFIQSYYVVVAGWTLGYSWMMLTQTRIPVEDFSANVKVVMPLTIIFQLITCAIVSIGLKKGVERFSKVLMPGLVILLLILAARSVSLAGAEEGLLYYLSPDFSRITPKVILFVLCQAFFSLCIGEAVLVTYGSYTRKSDNLINSAACIGLFDTLIALLSGLVIFPAMFAVNQMPDQGTGLIFNVMPEIFSRTPMGPFFGFGFFMILAFAALTTCIALTEIPANFLMQMAGYSREKSVAIIGALSISLSIPAALSRGAHPWLSTISIEAVNAKGLYEIMDFLWGGLGMVLGGLLLTLFVGWKWGAKNAAAELIQGAPGFRKAASLWSFYIRFIAPAAIILILASLFSGR